MVDMLVIGNMCVMMTEIQNIEGGQKDVLFRRANIKKDLVKEEEFMTFVQLF